MAAVIGLCLVWFATWTLLCNVAVLAGVHYATLFPQALAVPTLLTVSVSRWVLRSAMAQHGALKAAVVPIGMPAAWLAALAIAAGAVAAVLVADTLQQGSVISGTSPRWTGIATLVIVGAATMVGWLCGRGRPERLVTVSAPTQSWWRYTALLGVLLALYYFDHRQDEDDSNFINLALGAQRTLGAIYQFDTNVGDGPNVIFLPTYRLHSFELLVASVSSLLHLPAISVAQLVLPAPQLIMIAGVAWLLLEPVLGRRWLAGGLLVPAYLMLDTGSYSSWGLHGIIRLFEGKALLVTAIVPLIAGLTARWFRRCAGIDLVALALAQACAVGLSANGVYIGPFASGFVALAFLAARPSIETLTSAVALLPTLAYPAMAAAVIVVARLSHPSEIESAGAGLSQLISVAGSGRSGILMLFPLLLLGMGFAHTRFRLPAAMYAPLTLTVTLNPVSWAIISAFTGLLGFRIFWAIPVPMMVAALLIVMAMRAGIQREATLTGMAAAMLAGGIWFNTSETSAAFVTHWHWPTLKVDEQQYRDASLLAAMTDPRCAILAPEPVSQWLPTIEGAPYPVFTRRLYLVYYRFSMPDAERATRSRLADAVENGAAADTVDLRQLRIPIGTIAILREAGPNDAVKRLAGQLALPGPREIGDMLVWSGGCDAQ